MANGRRFLAVVECVNFDATLLDTDDLSTIRGASWAMLEVLASLPPQIPAAFPDLGCELVTAGASSCVLLIETSEAREVKAVEAALRHVVAVPSWLEGAGPMPDLDAVRPHLSFSVGVAELDEDFAAAETRARVALAADQYRSIDVDLPRIMSAEQRQLHMAEVADDAIATMKASDPRIATIEATWFREESRAAQMPCLFDGVRPVEALVWQTVDRQAIRNRRASASVAARKSLGRSGRRATFYQRHAGWEGAAEVGWSDSFEEIAGDAGHEAPEWVSQAAAAKMAVLSMDGNGFSTIRRAWLSEHGDRRTALADFGERISAARQQLLHDLVTGLAADKDLKLESPEKERVDGELRQTPVLRFETLIWGADEAVCVFPAFALERVLTLLHKALAGQAGQIEMPNGRSVRLTYGIGIVVCGYKTPIRLAVKLADDLRDSAKMSLHAIDDHDEIISRCDVMALSGMDVPVRSLSDERHALYGIEEEEQGAVFPIPLEKFGASLRAFADLRGVAGEREIGIPRARLAELLEEARSAPKRQGKGRIGLPKGNVEALLGKLGTLLDDPIYRRPNGEPFGRGFLTSSPFEWASEAPLAPLLHLLELWDLVEPAPVTEAAA